VRCGLVSHIRRVTIGAVPARESAMQSDNRFFDDAAKLASGVLGTLVGVRREIEQMARAQLERMLASMNLVARDEFEAVKAMAAKARSEQEDLVARVAALEAALAGRDVQPGAGAPKTPESDPK
jgi:BMFP domain-containing protein YqiC